MFWVCLIFSDIFFFFGGGGVAVDAGSKYRYQEIVRVAPWVEIYTHVHVNQYARSFENLSYMRNVDVDEGKARTKSLSSSLHYGRYGHLRICDKHSQIFSTKKGRQKSGIHT